MKKIGVLNQDLSTVIAGMGHGDMLVIGDAGLPIPPGPRRIDLAITKDLPPFLPTVEAIAGELKVERILIAEETGRISPQIQEGLKKIFLDVETKTITHEELKALSAKATAVVRTGEFTPYANVILVSGVVF